jgi:uncharacterized protein with von Willebrand factor type A (vWA) domain
MLAFDDFELVGDAAMHPAELLEPYGNIDPRRTAPTAGILWLQRIATHFERSNFLFRCSQAQGN